MCVCVLVCVCVGVCVCWCVNHSETNLVMTTSAVNLPIFQRSRFVIDDTSPPAQSQSNNNIGDQPNAFIQQNVWSPDNHSETNFDIEPNKVNSPMPMSNEQDDHSQQSAQILPLYSPTLDSPTLDSPTLGFTAPGSGRSSPTAVAGPSSFTAVAGPSSPTAVAGPSSSTAVAGPSSSTAVAGRRRHLSGAAPNRTSQTADSAHVTYIVIAIVTRLQQTKPSCSQVCMQKTL